MNWVYKTSPYDGKTIDAKIITSCRQPSDPNNELGWFSIDLHNCPHSTVIECKQQRVNVAQGEGFRRVRDDSWSFRNILRFEALLSTVGLADSQWTTGTAESDKPPSNEENQAIIRPVTVVMLTQSDFLGDAGQVRIVDLGTTPSPDILAFLTQTANGQETSASLESKRIANEALEWVAKANAVLREWQRTAVPGLQIRSDRFSHRVITELMSQNDDPPELGRGIGDMFACKVIAEQKESPERDIQRKFEDGWWDVMLIERIIRKPKHLLFLLNSLREYVRSTALYDWLTIPADKLKLEPYLGRSGGNSLRAAAANLTNFIREQKLPSWLYFGYSQFHEDRLFSSFASLVLDFADNRDVGLIPLVLDYSWESHRGPREADFKLMNWSAYPEESLPTTQEPIFRHNGYKMFVRYDYLKKLISTSDDTIPPDVKKVAIRLLEGESTPIDNINIDLAARCWIACHAEVPWIAGTEFDRIMPAIEKCAAAVFGDEVLMPPASDNEDSTLGFDDLFEDFIKGEQTAFVGGSLHDRLIERWLLDVKLPLFRCLLNPHDFAKLPIKLDSSNYVLILGQLRDRFSAMENPARERFVSLLGKFLVKVGTTLVQIARDAHDGNSDAIEIARFLSAQLAIVPADPHCIRQWRWSFISHLDDFLYLVRDDMTCPVPEGLNKSSIPNSKKHAKVTL